MAAKKETYQIGTDLTLYDSSSSPLIVRTVKLVLTQKDDEIIECCLIFQTDLKLYQHIDTNGLFNLEPDARISGNSCNFQESLPIQIEVSLKPDLLPHLQKHATNANEAVVYLLNQCQSPKSSESATVKTEQSLNNPKSLDPLLATESWLALSVKQYQKSAEVGYRTLWSHASLLGLSMVDSSQEKISESITNLFQDLGMSDLGFGDITKEITAESIGALADLLKSLDENISDTRPEDIPTRQLTKNPTTLYQVIDSKQPIIESIINFLNDDKWLFIKIPGESVLQLAFQGKNGKWNCYAKAREEQKQFVFYSICPVTVPENKRSPIAEFIARANYGTIIGNFELDYTNGEIRYKTSIDVGESNLTFDLIKQLIYTNVTMMDEYLPGIVSVIEGNVEPFDAIAQIEG